MKPQMSYEKTLQRLNSYSDSASEFISSRNQIMLSEFQKSPRYYTQKEAAAYCGVNVRTLDKYAKELGIDPTRHDDAKWVLDIFELYKIYDALPDQLKMVKHQGRPEGTGQQVISFNNQKGGVSKTISSITVATGIATEYRERYRVLFVDLDPQANASMFHYPAAAEQGAFTATDLLYGNYELEAGETFEDLVKDACIQTVIPNLSILPASQEDRAYNQYEIMHSRENPYGLLKDILKQVEDDFDVVIIDTPPSTDLVTLNAYFAATGIIIPIIPSATDIDATASYARFLPGMYSNFREFGHPGYDFIKALPTNYDPSSSSAIENIRHLNRIFGADQFQAGLHAREGFKKCGDAMCTVFDISSSEYDGSRSTFLKARTIAENVVTSVMGEILSVWSAQKESNNG